MNRIKELRRRKKLTQAQLAELAGTDNSQIYRLENGERRLTQDWMERLAPHLGVSPADLMPAQDLQTTPVSSIQVVGRVAAGEWQEAVEIEPGERFVFQAPIPARYRGKAYALQVGGPSMNRHYPEGSYVICVRLGDLDDELRIGDHVQVCRRDKHGLIEATIKELAQSDDGKLWLWPRSTDPEHQVPMPMPQDRGDHNHHAGAPEAEIVGVVIGAYQHRRRG